MGKYSDCLSQTPLARPEYAIYTPKIDCKTVCIFGCKSHNGPPLALGRHQKSDKRFGVKLKMKSLTGERR